MKRLALAFALGITTLLFLLPSVAGAGGFHHRHHGHHGFVVVAPAVVAVAPRPAVFIASPAVVVAPRFVAPPVVVAAPFVAVRPVHPCARWWWNGWQWVWVRC